MSQYRRLGMKTVCWGRPAPTCFFDHQYIGLFLHSPDPRQCHVRSPQYLGDAAPVCWSRPPSPTCGLLSQVLPVSLCRAKLSEGGAATQFGKYPTNKISRAEWFRIQFWKPLKNTHGRVRTNMWKPPTAKLEALFWSRVNQGQLSEQNIRPNLPNIIGSHLLCPSKHLFG